MKVEKFNISENCINFIEKNNMISVQFDSKNLELSNYYDKFVIYFQNSIFNMKSFIYFLLNSIKSGSSIDGVIIIEENIIF